jgi:hypothetical protein
VNHFTIGDALVFLGCLAFFILLLLEGKIDATDFYSLRR